MVGAGGNVLQGGDGVDGHLRHLDEAELNVLTAWYDWVENNLGIDLDLIVYLRYLELSIIYYYYLLLNQSLSTIISYYPLVYNILYSGPYLLQDQPGGGPWQAAVQGQEGGGGGTNGLHQGTTVTTLTTARDHSAIKQNLM